MMESYLTRIGSGGHAYETGIFRSTTLVPGEKPFVRYTRFEMVSPLHNGLGLSSSGRFLLRCA